MSASAPELTPLSVKHKPAPEFHAYTRTDALYCPSCHFPKFYEQLRNLISCTRFDLCYSGHILSRSMSKPCKVHKQAAKRTLRYLRITQHYALTYYYAPSSPISISGYVDANWVEAEYVATALASREALWISELITELKLPFNISTAPITLFCDDQSTIALAESPSFSSKLKHIKISFYFLKELIANGFIKLVQEDMLSLLDSFCRETNLPHQPNDSAEFELFPKHEHPIAASMSNDIEIDYVHMPLSRKGLHKGFAIVNFTKFKAALMFNAIHHKRAVEIGTHTSFVCEVAFAAIQGVEAHLQKWRLGSTPSLNCVSQEPLLFNPPCNGFVNCLSDRLQGQKLSTLSPSTATSSSSMLSPALATHMEGDVGSGSPWHLSSSPLSLQSLPSALKANSAPTATKSCVKKEERKRGSLQGKIMNVEGVQMGSSKKRSGKDHVVAWPMNMTSMRMRGKLAAPSSNESVPQKKRKKFQKEKAKYEGSAATSTSSSLVQQRVASRLAQIEEEDKDHEDAIPLRQSFAWIYNGVLRFFWHSGLSKLSVSQIVMYVKQN
ncbi:hypothetical protein L7F22_046761 [Adiantum nelumboides]|nr:hypothetical protein [Adiantum nelumboides]